MQVNKSSFLPIYFTLLLACFAIQTSHAEISYSLNLDAGTAFDTNPSFLPDNDADLTSTYLLLLKPSGTLLWSQSKHRFSLNVKYITEARDKNDSLHDKSMFDSDWTYSYMYQDWGHFFLKSRIIQSEYGPHCVDIPEFMGRTLRYNFSPEFEFQPVDYFRLKISLMGESKTYQDYETDGVSNIVHGENWDEYGVYTEAQYDIIPQMSFLSGFSYSVRDYPDFDDMPGYIHHEASFGFKNILPQGTDITVLAHLYRYQFKGEVPRRMDAAYTNYGVSMTTSHPMTPDCKVSFSAFSIFEISERGIRRFYHNQGASLTFDYTNVGPFSFHSFLKYNKLDYQGQEPEVVRRTRHAELSINYQLNEWMQIGTHYRYFEHTPEESELQINEQRIALQISFRTSGVFGSK